MVEDKNNAPTKYQTPIMGIGVHIENKSIVLNGYLSTHDLIGCYTMSPERARWLADLLNRTADELDPEEKK